MTGISLSEGVESGWWKGRGVPNDRSGRASVLSSRGHQFSEEQGLESPRSLDAGCRLSDRAKEPKTDGLQEVAEAPMRRFPGSHRLLPGSTGPCPDSRAWKPASCEARSRDG